MLFKKLNKGVTVGVLINFLLFSSIPINGYGAHLENLSDCEAIFGQCKLNRIRKKTSKLIKTIDEYKYGRKSVDEVTLQIASLKRTASKAFKKNYKVHKIMQQANLEIEKFMLDMMNEAGEREELMLPKGIRVKSDDLPNTYESVGLFLNQLQDYEDNDWKVEEERQFHKELIKDGYFKKAPSNGIDDQESKILFAYVSIFCGCLLCMLPFGVTYAAGGTLISGGLWSLSENSFVNKDEINRVQYEGGYVNDGYNF